MLGEAEAQQAPANAPNSFPQTTGQEERGPPGGRSTSRGLNSRGARLCPTAPARQEGKRLRKRRGQGKPSRTPSRFREQFSNNNNDPAPGAARLPPAAGRCRQRPTPMPAPQAAGPQAPPPPRAHPDAEAVREQVVGDVQGPWAGAALRLGRLAARRPAGRLAESAVGAEAGAQQRQGAERRVGAEAGPGEALQEQQRHRGALATARPAALPGLNARPAAPPRGRAKPPALEKAETGPEPPAPAPGAASARHPAR